MYLWEKKTDLLSLNLPAVLCRADFLLAEKCFKFKILLAFSGAKYIKI